MGKAVGAHANDRDRAVHTVDEAVLVFTAPQVK
jgi:hypothetical protein